MSGIKIICPICTDEFRGTDDIYSTSCGHLYHYMCMNQWQSRSTSCPQCRAHNPTQHKVFLNIEDPESAPSAPSIDDEDLKVKLASSVDKIHELQALLDESELNFFHLQDQFTSVQEIRNQLERTVAQNNDNESNFLRLHAQYSESEDRFKILQEENERLSVENEYKSKELALRATEISTLKESLASIKHSSPSDTVANTRVGILEQKLRHVMSELEKEISNSTQLAIDKIKLQSYIQRIEMNVHVPIAKINSAEPNTTEHSTGKMVSSIQNIPPATTVTQIVEERKLDSSSVLLHNFPFKEMGDSLAGSVISIAEKISVIITKDDIINIKILQGGARRPPNSTTVYVQFKTDDIKMKFLANRDIIRKDEIFAKVSIKEFTDGKVHALFVYANKKLRGTVFGHVVCMNNTIIAKKYRSDNNYVTIRSTNQVDELLRSHLLAKKEKPSVYLEEDKCDDCYYKI